MVRADASALTTVANTANNTADKAVLRLAIGLGLSVLIAYGMGLPAPFVTCVLAVLLLCKPGPSIPLVKGLVLALLIALLMLAGVLLVPILEHYAVAGLLIIAVLLFVVFRAGARSANPFTIIFVITFTFVPVAGVADQALVSVLSIAMALGLGVGVFVSGMSHALFPDPPRPVALQPAPAGLDLQAASWAALRATLVVMPVLVLALGNPSFYLAAIIKTVTLGQQASSANARSAGRELVGSTLAGALLAAAVWGGLTLRPNLWMLMLWIVAAALWTGVRLYRLRPTAFAPTFWTNALVTMLILLGPAIEDSANGKDVYRASAIRVALFVGVALYAWATVRVLDRWRMANSNRAG
ncbi:DUF2955 domain-containing protein [Variovorax sp. J22P168]|uniref:DUF2955 domain-containing protein n=1 Tax=Variovorax jilinensis TaxID=3053513 RepID=UPI0025787934|nr:DUF2955 domain-containing protein [Variovorax sp. J22P168]MDM0015783.1 DUF2955 domain-containing protein [Variovorax sp. J22P168]